MKYSGTFALLVVLLLTSAVVAAVWLFSWSNQAFWSGCDSDPQRFEKAVQDLIIENDNALYTAQSEARIEFLFLWIAWVFTISIGIPILALILGFRLLDRIFGPPQPDHAQDIS